MFAVVISGPPGVGKTTALTALMDALADDRVTHAGVDVDEVAWSYPFPDLSQRCAHLSAWRASHVRTGASLFVAAEIISSIDHLVHVLDALGADDHLLVELTARTATLRARVRRREPEGWSGLSHLLGEIDDLQRRADVLDSAHLVYDTEHASIAEIVAGIRAARPDRLFLEPAPG